MNLSLDLSIALCAIGPFAAAVLAPVLQRAIGWWAGVVLAIVPAAIFVYLIGFVGPVSHGETVRAAIDWVPAYGLSLSLFIDGLSLTFALAISGIGALILLYAAGYLRGHNHQGRFLAFMMMFMGAMLGLVLADSLVALYLFWELTTVTSFLLIGFDHMRQAARRAAIQALVVTNIGGLALLVGAIALFGAFGTWELSGLRELGDAVRGHAAYGLVLVAFLLAAFTKSAQVPFHFWLPAAMQAPTPVSAFLHSATMVQAGVYLLARTSPMIGGTPAWTAILMVAGGVTLLWGGIAALRQTDLKQMLAQTTTASLGLLVLLIGIGTKEALLAAMLYFVAHALYKAALFLVAGLIEHETGVRDITALGGLRDKMAATFLAAIAAGVSMVGLPPSLGFFAKEEAYLAGTAGDWQTLAALVVLVAGYALLSVVGLAVAIRPFMGPLPATPRTPHEGPVAMLAGPLVLGISGLVVGWMVAWLGEAIVAPAASAVYGNAIDAHLGAVNLFSAAFALSVLTWVLGGLLYWRLDTIRTLLRRVVPAWTFEQGFDQLMFGLIRLSGAVTRTWHHGRLELYLTVVFAALGIALLAPLMMTGGLRPPPAWPDLTFYEWGIVGLAVCGVITVMMATTRLFAILALGVQGLAVATLFMLFGAPDLSFTQFMVEILSVVILALVMTRLRLDAQDPRELEDLLRDGSIALLCGVGVTATLLAILDGPLDPRLSDFFIANSVPVAHGHNIVNVILVDFRGLDTLGEISVVMTAGIAVLALIRTVAKPARKPAPPTPRPATETAS